MRQLIIESLQLRLEEEIAPQNPIKFLKTLDVNDYIDNVISIVYLYTRAKKGLNKHTIFVSEVICAIGHGIRNKYKMKRNSALAAKAGAFVLYTFEELQLLQIIKGQGANGHNSYIVQVLDDDGICDLWNNLDASKIEKLPSLTPYEPWTSSKHPTGAMLVKTGNKAVAEMMNPIDHKLVFDCINKSQKVGWRINKQVFEVQQWAFRNKAEAFNDIWNAHSKEAKATKMRETKAISDIAKRFIDNTFYHLYYYDFRGRKYPTTAYLHEQGSDLAKGLLLRDDCKSIGEKGFFWLMVSIASNWAGDAGRDDGAKTDKIPLLDRFHWAKDNEEIFLSYAESPKVNQGWMRADKPWQFLAACFELYHLRTWQAAINDFENYEYPSHLECYIDGSNNGSQHLSALTRDDITAPYVNLVPQELPGDLYSYVADHVWEHLATLASTMSKEHVAECESLIDTLIDLKQQINEAPTASERRLSLIEQIKKLKLAKKDLANDASAIYWLRVTDKKQRRKIVKRNVMTLPYGGTAYGLGQQQINDARKHGIGLLSFMEWKWGAFLGREVFNDCRVSLERPMQLLSVFENAGKKAEAEGRFLRWTVPITNFPVVQNYTEGKVKKTWIQYGPPRGERQKTGYYENTLQLHICYIEDVKPSKGKQSQGASPNAIHSLDAGHLVMTVAYADFPVTTIHDSYGCLLADMPELFKLVRETFVELYKADPLKSIMNEIGGDISEIKLGNLDLEQVLESEYCFC